MLIQKLKDNYSSKSIRKGISTILHVHKGVATKEADAHCGWVSGAPNGQMYKSIIPAPMVPACNVINGWDDVDSKKYAPGLECLGAHVENDIEQLIEKLYIVLLPQFKPDGMLHPFLHACTASLIEHHPVIKKDLRQSNLIVKKLEKAAADAEICNVKSQIHQQSCIFGHKKLRKIFVLGIQI